MLTIFSCFSPAVVSPSRLEVEGEVTGLQSATTWPSLHTVPLGDMMTVRKIKNITRLMNMNLK